MSPTARQGELTLRTMLTNLHAKDLQQPRRFPSEVLLATPAVLIPLAPAASQRFSTILRTREIGGVSSASAFNWWIASDESQVIPIAIETR
jgi:hypothetical protein